MSLTNGDRLYREFAKIAKSHASQTALFLPDGALTYQELDLYSDCVAQTLSESDRQDPVGLVLHPGKAFYISLLGAMKAGVRAIPWDPLDPIPAALPFKKCFAIEALSPLLEAQGSQVLDLNFKTPTIAFQARQSLTGHQPIHSLRTSGSSGNPSFVTHARKNLLLHAVEVGQAYAYQSGEVHASLSRHTSAAGINSFWRLILNGQTALFCDLRQETLLQIGKRLTRHRIASLHGAPTIIKTLLETSPEPATFRALQLLLIGGEQVSKSFLQALSPFISPECILQLNYSSTETMHISGYRQRFSELLKEDFIPCGKVYASRQILIVDPDLNPVVLGHTGEIVVRSAHLALDLEGQQASARLWLDPKCPEQKFYRTGDLGRLNADGLLEHLGRIDRQIKIRGIRIDPALIEKEMLHLPAVRDARVFALNHEGHKILVAAWVGDKQAPSNEAIIQSLQDVLPVHAIPSHLIAVSSLPLLANGKTDFKRLQKWAVEALSRLNKQTQETDLDLYGRLKSAWEKVLGHALSENPGSFIAEGGDSLRAIRLIAELESWGISALNLVWLSQHSSLEKQLEALQALPGDAPAQLAIEPSPTRSERLEEGPELDKAHILERLGW